MDKIGADPEKAVKTIIDRLGGNPCPIQVAIGAESDFKGIVDLMTMKAYFYDGGPHEIADIKEIPEELKEKYKQIFNKLQFEAGVHRVQRVPKTETQGRVHTSTVTVAILKERNETEVKINPDEIRIDTFRSSGAGGQHVNTTNSAIRITHLKTGIVVSCQDGRSQHDNKDKALKVLRSRLYNYYESKASKEFSEKRSKQVGTGMRSEKIRTYNFPQNRVTDHRINYSYKNIEKVMQGDFEPF
ncbi:uncharacterized protein LOC106159211 [Lingula anatina]|uniref:Uncharacterized protein LOC106159211 n=1 Tax=Lingula anatina TaxID=7574 RepID=A0A2R2MMW7_LINAN|nr:uncharacterized protein LOC106159211 [Lingula anatina]|eukprot:XP_023931402.1 uncharacterized protein LOC106159211 [Lingula anatina]